VAHEPSVRGNVLAQKLIQLTMPGVPDVYQGCETVTLSLVDPDNRRPVDWTDRGERLARVVAAEPALDLDDEKMRVTARALRVRREDPAAFVGEGTTYTGLPCSSPHALAFARGDADGLRVVTVATVAAGTLAAGGGFGDAVVELPPGSWRDVLADGDDVITGGSVSLATLLAHRPVALLVRHS
jgi:(1->4)-alpha-D-glucan 1-alpha-D-glucosylmutase